MRNRKRPICEARSFPISHFPAQPGKVGDRINDRSLESEAEDGSATPWLVHTGNGRGC